ncbi:hypothetical protein P3T76_000782 [Phytophthora citrophthora]|uniref:Uncharacterized protein n=1 Tax=Phytophthora citrophthora TaxID=4793 RepID=A0AAD9H2E6_9STRA|nr:hypothetical protein P3T76_000782 [Phytophthora citrophthora]
MARMWWKKLNRFSSFKRLENCNSLFWEAIGNRLYDRDLYLFAADCYDKTMAESQFVPSNRFRYCYLTSLLGRKSHKTGLCEKISATSRTSPTSKKKPHHIDCSSRRKLPTKPSRRAERKIAGEPQPRGVSNNGPTEQKHPFPGHNDTIEKRSEDAKKSNEVDSHSPSKRTPSVVKRLRARRPSADPTIKTIVSSDPDHIPSDTAQTMTGSSSTSLLDVYPIEKRDTEAFVASCGREPGFADLDLDELGKFARLAHYRARVLAGKHTSVTTLGTTKVKPQWLQELEKAIALIETHRKRNVASCKVVIESDSVAHLSEVHTRLVLQITTLCQQYTRENGETFFTRRLRGITRRLVQWKFSRISEVVAELDNAKTIATEEEKQRNLEFYHVHSNST